MARVLAAIPVKPFGVAKARLAPLLDGRARARLGKALAERTARTAMAAGADAVIVTGDEAVMAWARTLGLGVIAESGAGLDAAAGTGRDAARARGEPWMILHADLPLLAVADLREMTAAIGAGGIALAPAIDGGTNVIAGHDEFPFAYGPGSFHRHLAAAIRRGTGTVVNRIGLALDLDRPEDLTRAAGLAAGSWLSAHMV